MKYIKLILICLIFGVWITPAFAEQILVQPTHDYNSSSSSFYNFDQRLGTGISGTFYSISFYWAHTAGLGDSSYSAILYECPDSTYTSCGNSFSFTDTNLVPVGTPKTLYTVYAESLIILNPSKYYTVSFEYGSGGVQGDGVFYGSYLSGYANGDCVLSGGSCGMNDVYFVVDDGTGFQNQTRVISVTPYDKQVVASTTVTTLGFHVYINGDYDASTINFKISPMNNLVDYGFNYSNVLNYSTTTSQVGDIYFSTTTSSLLSSGNYIVDISVTPSTVFSFFQPYTVSSSTMFFVGNSTQFGLDYDKTQDEVATLFQTIATSTSTSTPITSCDFMSAIGANLPGWLSGNATSTWNFKNCIYSLFVPSQADQAKLWKEAKDSVFLKAPWGYLTIFMSKFSASTTDSSAVPDIDFTIPQGLAMAGTNVHLTLYDDVFGPSSLLNTKTSTTSDEYPVALTFIDEVEPYWDSLLYTVLGIYILMSLVRFGTSVGFFGSDVAYKNREVGKGFVIHSRDKLS